MVHLPIHPMFLQTTLTILPVAQEELVQVYLAVLVRTLIKLQPIIPHQKTRGMDTLVALVDLLALLVRLVLVTTEQLDLLAPQDLMALQYQETLI
jgi:hypothetical protein